MNSTATLQLIIQLQSEAEGQLGAIRSQVQGLGQDVEQAGGGGGGGLFGKLFANATNIASSIGLLQGVGSAIAGVGQSLISGSAQFEGYEARFASLMGSTDAAKAKIQELSQFASTTPFELPDVIQASQSLQVFGGAALNTKENLAIVGNAAAATGQNIGDVSFWFARAYSAIQNGQPFGEAAQNLQQMGVMSGDTVVKLNALKDSGASNQQVWQSFSSSLNAPTDAMAKLGGTWTGLTSTLSDSWALLMRTFGQPLFESLKPQLGELITALSSSGLIDAVGQLGSAFASMLGPAISFVAGTVIPGVVSAIEYIAPAVSGAVDVLLQIGGVFMDLAGQAMGWGENIVSQLAGGMMSAASSVMEVLGGIGNMIADLLMPGSPPKLLPGLTDWGAGAITAYMDGWGKADFGVFNSISDSIKGALDGIAKASGDKGINVAGVLLGSQDDIARAINEVRTLGGVSEETFQSIIAAAGPAGPQISGLVRSYLDLEAATQNVAAAQAELNNITAEYSAKLDPLNAQLKGIQNQKQLLQDQQRLAKLYEEAGAAAQGSAEQQIKMLEIQELQTRMQIRSTEQERDSAVGAAKAKLTAAQQQQAAAQAQVDQQKALLDVNKKQNDLIAQQTKAMSGAAGAMKGAANAMKPLADAAEAVKGPVQAVSAAVDSVNTAASATAATVTSTVSPAFQAFQAAVAPVGAFLQDNLMPVLLGIGTAITIAVLPAIISFIGTMAASAAAAITAAGSFLLMLAPFIAIGVAAAALAAVWQSNFGGIQQIIQSIVDAVVNGFGEGGILGAINGLVTGLTAAWPAIVAWFSLALTTIVAQVSTWGMALVDWATPYLTLAVQTLNTWIAGIWTWIQTQAPIWLAQLATWGMALVDWATPYLTLAVQTLNTWIAGIWTWIQTQAPIWLAQLATWGMALVDWIAPAIPGALAALGGMASSLWAWVSAQAAPLLASFGAWASSIAAWIPGATAQFLAAWPGMLSGFLDWIAGAVSPILAQLATWAGAFLSWIGPMIPPFLAQIGAMIPPLLVALAGIALAIVTWVAETAVVIVGKVASWALAMLGWVKDNVLPALPGALAGIVTAITSFLGGVVGSIASEAANLGKSIVDGIIKGVSNAAGALTNKLRDLANSALDVAKKALGIASPSTVFASLVGAQIPAGVAKGIEQATPKAMGAMADMAGKLTGMIGSTTGAFASLAGAAQVPHSAMAQFADTMVDVIAMFNSVYQRVRGLMLSDALHFLGSANVIFDSVSKGADALGKLAGLGQISETAVDRFGTAMLAVILAFDSVAKVVRGLLLINAKFITADATAIFETVSKGADALVKLVGLGDVSAAAIGRFADGMRLVIVALAEVAGQMAGGGLAQAQTFAAGAGQVLATVGASVDALNKLNALGSAIPGIFLRFATYVRVLVNRMAEAAGEVSGQALEAAAAFAAGAGKVIGAVSNGVDAFTKLEGMGAAVPGMFLAFATYLRVLVDRMAEAAATVSQDALAAAVRFAEGAGKVIGVVASGVDAFTKLNTLGDAVPGIFLKFASYVMVLVNRMGEAAAGINAGALTAAVAFAEGAGKVVGIIGGAVDGFTKLADFQGVPQAAFVAFANALDQAVTWIWNVSQDFTVKGVQAAAAFAESAGKTVAFIGAAVDGFTKLAEFQGVPLAAFVAFGYALDSAITWIWNVSQDFTVEGVAAAAAFAEGAGKTVGIIGSAVDGFAKLAVFEGVPQAAFAAFGAALRSALDALIAISAQFAAESVSAAAAFGEGAGKALAFIGNAVDSFGKLADMGRLSQGAVNAFSYNIVLVVSQLQQLARVFSVEALDAVGLFSAAVGRAVAGLGAAGDSLMKLADTTRLKPDAVNAWSFNVVLVVAQLQQLARVFTTEALAAAATFAAGVAAVAQSVKAALDALATLAGAKQLRGDVLAAFIAAAQALVAQMAAYLPPNAETIGANTITGLINGIVGQRAALITAMVATVMAAVTAAQQALGIASPSTVFEALGQFSGAGMISGMERMVPAVAGAGATLGAAASRGAAGVAAGGGGGGGGGTTVNVTIASGAIVLSSGAGGKLSDADLRRLAALIGQEIATQAGGRR